MKTNAWFISTIQLLLLRSIFAATQTQAPCAYALSDPQLQAQPREQKQPIEGLDKNSVLKSSDSESSVGLIGLKKTPEQTFGAAPQDALGLLDEQNAPSPPLSLAPNFPIAQTANSNTLDSKPGIAFDGTNFFCAWQDGNDIYGARVAPSGIALDGNGIPISVGMNEATDPPSVCFDGTNYFITWCANRSGVNEIYGARVTPSGQVIDPHGIKITTGSNTEIRMPGIAFDGQNLLIVWRTLKLGGNNIYGAIVSKEGVNLGSPGGFAMTDLYCCCYPAVAFDGKNYMVVWYDSRNGGWKVYGARVDKSGTVLDFDGFPICTEAQDKAYPIIAFDGTNYLVVWYDSRPNNSDQDGSAYGARVAPDGTVLDKPSFKIADNVQGSIPVQVAFDGLNYLVVWSSCVVGDEAHFRLTDVYGKRITTNGQFIDKQGIPICTSFGHQWGPTIGYGGGRYLVAWADGSFGYNRGDNPIGNWIYGQIIDRNEPPEDMPCQDVTPVTGMWTEQVCSSNGAVIFNKGLALNSNNAYLFGDNGGVRFSNGQWNDCGQSAWTFGAWAGGADDIWTGGWAGNIDHWDGQEWVGSGLGQARIISGIWGINGQKMWASTDGGTLFEYDFTARQWNRVSTGVPYDLADIWGTSADNIYAVGERGTILHFDGVAWSLMSGVPTDQGLNAIWGTGANDVFAVGDWGTILHFDGSRWTLMETCTTEHLFGIWGLSYCDAFAVGLGGVILHFDGGAWSREDCGSTKDLMTVFGACDPATSIGTVWVAGAGVAGAGNTCHVTQKLRATKAAPVITWAAPAAITYPTPLSGAQLNATANVQGTFVYSPAAGTVLTANIRTLSVRFTPTDTTDYTTATATQKLTVNKAAPVITWPAPAAITYPTPLSSAQLNATANVPGAFVYSPAAGTVMTANIRTLSVRFTPTDTTDYTTATATQKLTVNKAVPVITWAAPTPITYPTALSSAQLDATANVQGAFVYTPAAGKVLTAGTQTLSVKFTPTDTTDYISATATQSLTVN